MLLFLDHALRVYWLACKSGLEIKKKKILYEYVRIDNEYSRYNLFHNTHNSLHITKCSNVG